MANQTMNQLNQQMDRMVLPFQRYGALMLNSFDRVASFQLNSLQTYTHFALRQCRDAMEIHDQQSMRQYLEKQTDALRDLSKKMTEDAETLASIGQEFTMQAQRVTEQNARTFTDMTHALERSAQQDVERAAGPH